MTSTNEYEIFVNLVGKVKRFVQHSQDDDITELAKDAVNFAYAEGYRRHDWPSLRRISEGFHSFVSRDSYVDKDGSPVTVGSGEIDTYKIAGYLALPAEIGDIYAIYQGDPAGSFVAPPRLQELAPDTFLTAMAHDPDEVGSEAMIFTRIGTTPLRLPLLKNEPLTAVSNSGSDTNKILITGRVGSNNWIGESTDVVTLSGTTPVASTAGNWREGWNISRITIQGTHAGTVQIYGSTTNALYWSRRATAVDGTGPSFDSEIKTLLRLWPVSTEQTRYTIYYKASLRPLIHDQDELQIPIAQYVEEKAIARLYEYKRLNDLAQVHEARAEDLIIRTIMDHESGQLHMSQPAYAKANLGRSRFAHIWSY